MRPPPPLLLQRQKARRPATQAILLLKNHLRRRDEKNIDGSDMRHRNPTAPTNHDAHEHSRRSEGRGIRFPPDATSPASSAPVPSNLDQRWIPVMCGTSPSSPRVKFRPRFRHGRPNSQTEDVHAVHENHQKQNVNSKIQPQGLLTGTQARAPFSPVAKQPDIAFPGFIKNPTPSAVAHARRRGRICPVKSGSNVDSCYVRHLPVIPASQIPSALSTRPAKQPDRRRSRGP